VEFLIGRGTSKHCGLLQVTYALILGRYLNTWYYGLIHRCCENSHHDIVALSTYVYLLICSSYARFLTPACPSVSFLTQRSVFQWTFLEIRGLVPRGRGSVSRVRCVVEFWREFVCALPVHCTSPSETFEKFSAHVGDPWGTQIHCPVFIWFVYRTAQGIERYRTWHQTALRLWCKLTLKFKTSTFATCTKQISGMALPR
jgi:hypothetical protein